MCTSTLSAPRSSVRLSLVTLLLCSSLHGAAQEVQPPLQRSSQPRVGVPSAPSALQDLPEVQVTPDAGNLRATLSPEGTELARGCQGNLLKNGDVSTFTLGSSSNFPPSTVPGWSPSVYTPQLAATAGFGGAPGWLLAWGYQAGGESFHQNVQLTPGTYRLRVAARHVNAATNPTPAQYRVAFRTALSSNPWGTPGVVTLNSAPLGATWSVQSYTFTLTSPASVMQVNTFNTNPQAAVNGRPERVSWAGYDSFCLERVKPRRGMTWTVRELRGDLVNVGNHAGTNPYQGDTPETATLPVLCLRQSGLPVPAGLTPDFYHGWAKGEVRLSTPVTGSVMNSPALADAICAAQFGTGWRMAEFHDGQGGHTFWAVMGHAALAQAFKSKSTFWVAINDQPANVWNSVP